MHREISHAGKNLQPESRLFLYLLTAVLAVLIAADLWLWLSTGADVVTLFGFRFSLALVPAILGGARILYGSLDSLFEGRIGADLAVAVACVAAILARRPEVAEEVVFVGLLGECLEHLTFERTQRAVRSIVAVCPRRCWRLRDGREERVLVADLRVGDRVVVKPGARVPADGVVLDGRSSLDVSALTGESMPAERGPGDEVLAGSLNQLGALTIEARRVAEHTVVGRVIELTAKALQDKAPIERTADRMARWFLPAVLALAAVTFVGALTFASFWGRDKDGARLPFYDATQTSAVSQAVPPTLAVLVVACPCALILATPAAILATLGRLAGTGVLLKGGSALERLARVNVFAFDKTGTLTEGRLEIGEIGALQGVSSDELLAVAAAAEARSEHPLARVILAEAARRGLTPEAVEDFRAHPGGGVTARTTADAVVVGNRRLLEEQGVAVPSEASALLERLDADGQTALLVARGGRVLGAVGARDMVRVEAAAVIAELRGLGVEELALLTGDRPAPAKRVAEALGVLEVHAELLPAQKAEWIAGRQAQGKRVGMVGDGVNDAPALAKADVGVAVGGGAEVAAEAGDVVLMSADGLKHLPLLVRLSRETVRVIRQNIVVFAFSYNVVGVVVTAWLWPLLAPSAWWYEQSPLAAVIFHQIGSLAVLLNAMRLLAFERSGGPAWAGWRERLAGVNRWLEKRFDVEEWLHTLLHHWRPVGLTLLLLAAAAYGLSGLTVVGPDERAVVRRFGRALPDDLGPGLYWTWPWPVDAVTRVQPDHVYTLEVGFRGTGQAGNRPAVRSWASSHGDDGVKRMPEEAVMMTGDGNLVEMQATVRYTIRDPRVYLFDVADAPGVVRDAAESVLRELVAGKTFADLLTRDREAFHTEALARMQARCDGYGGRGLGVRLEGVSLADLHPPQEVVGAYHQVTMAMEKSDERVNQATADALGRERAEEANKTAAIRKAEAEALDKVRRAEATRDAVLARVQARKALAWDQEWALFRDAVQEAWNDPLPDEDERLRRAERHYTERRSEAVARQALLTDFRLYWEALASALADREKVVIDAENVPGRRRLWLTPLQPFPFAWPAGPAPVESREGP